MSYKIFCKISIRYLRNVFNPETVNSKREMSRTIELVTIVASLSKNRHVERCKTLDCISEKGIA